MKLLTLSLKNFKGIKYLEVPFDGKNASIYGTNATGKTTIADAISWLMYDKPSTDEKGFCPKPKDNHGEDIHYLDTVVEASFLTDSGSIVLSKTFSEVWNKKRGSVEDTFTGHTVAYQIDGVPVQKKEYDERINTLCPMDIAPWLMQPKYFASVLGWKDRRKALLDVCGDVDQLDVITTTPALQDLLAILKKPDSEDLYSVEEYQMIARSRLKKINKELEVLPERIDEARRTVVDLPASEDPEYLGTKQRYYVKSLAKHQEDLAALKASGPALAIRQQLQELDMQERQARFDWNSQNAVDDSGIREMQAQAKEWSYDLQDLERDLKNAKSNLSMAQISREFYTKQYEALKAEEFTASGICPACGQLLPEEKLIEEEANWNENHSKALEKIKKCVEEQCSKPILQRLTETVENLQLRIAKKAEERVALMKRMETKKNAFTEPEPFEATSTYAEIQAKRKSLQEDQLAASQVMQTQAEDIQRKIDADTIELARINRRIAAGEAMVQQTVRIKELEDQMHQLAVEYEDYKAGAALCEAYITARINMLDERINSKFKTVSFQLFETQINGGITECCKVLVPGPGSLVRYESANNAAQINAGLEIIDTLAEHYGYSLPVVVDNAESVVRLTPIHAQVIRLVVSDQDKILRAEADR